MNRTRISPLLAGTVIFCAAVTSAHAQWKNPWTTPPSAASLNQYIWHSPHWEARRYLREHPVEGTANAPAPTAQQQAPAAQPGPQPTAQAEPVELDEYSLDETDVEALDEDELADPFAEMEGEVPYREDLSAWYEQTLSDFDEWANDYNLAYAFAFLIARSTEIGRDRILSAEEKEELVHDVNDTLAENGSFDHLDDDAKQALYAQTLVSAGMLSALYGTAAEHKDRELLAQAKTFARQVIAGDSPD